MASSIPVFISDGHWTIECVKMLIVTLVIFSLIVYIAALLFGQTLTEKMSLRGHNNRILLIAAHPDDECMFFSPFLLSASADERTDVNVLCLTNGDYYGRGKVREKEIIKSCQILGIPPDHVSVVNDRYLPDDPKAVWETSHLESRLYAAVNKVQPHYIVTFDDYGVSGHKNHITVSKVVRSIFESRDKFRGVEYAYYLESVSLWRKYLGLLELPFTFLFSSHTFLLSPRQIFLAQRAMFSHRSQLAWFRILYIFLSRYMIVNSFKVDRKPIGQDIDM